MSINLEDIKRKLEALKNNKSINSTPSGGGQKYFKADGPAKIRFLTPPGSDEPIKEYYWHYPEKGKSFMCEKKTHNTGECLFCDTATTLWQTYDAGGRQNEALGDAAKKLFANPRYYAPVLVRGQEADGVQLYGFPKEVATSFMETLVNPDYEVLVTDPLAGRDFDVSIVTKTGKNTTYKTTKITPSPKQTAVVSAAMNKTLEEVYAEIPDMNSLFKPAAETAMREAVDKYLSVLLEKTSVEVPTSQDASDNSSEEDAVEEAMRKLENQ